MGTLDYILLVIVSVFGIWGLLKGLIREVFGILGLILGYLLAFNLYLPVSHVYTSLGVSVSVSVAEPLGFVTAFIFVFLVVTIIGYLTGRFFKAIKLGTLDRIGGFFFGAAKAGFILGLILNLLLSILPTDMSFRRTLTTSPVSVQLARLAPVAFDYLNKLPEIARNNPFFKPVK